jgi:uncharacterized protein (DUF1778 family)
MSDKARTKDKRIDLRLTQEQKELLERAATLKGISVSAYTLFHVLPAAKQDLDSHERLILSDRDRDLFMSVMENPPELKGKLKSAIALYKQKYRMRSPHSNTKR